MASAAAEWADTDRWAWRMRRCAPTEPWISSELSGIGHFRMARTEDRRLLQRGRGVRRPYRQLRSHHWQECWLRSANIQQLGLLLRRRGRVAGGFLPGGLASCTADTRVLIEGTAGFWFKLYDGSKEKVNRGRLQFGPQFSYVTRNAWSGNGHRAARDRRHGFHVVPLLPAVDQRQRLSEVQAGTRSRRNAFRVPFFCVG